MCWWKSRWPANLPQADALIAAAKKNQRILQVGHVERFNPAVIAVEPIVNRPLFFEVHRLGVFTAAQPGCGCDLRFDDS